MFMRKIKDRLLDGSIDSEHYIAYICYLTILLPLFLSVLGILVINHFPYPLLKWLVYIILIILIGFISYRILKKDITYFKNKRFMLGFVLLPSFLLSALFALSWLTLFFQNLDNFVNQYPIFPHPGEKILGSVKITFSLFSSMFSVIAIITISLFLNGIVPKSMQKVNIGFKERKKRFLIKIIVFVVSVLVTWIFSLVDKNNWIIVAFIYSMVTTGFTPKNIYHFIFNKTIDDDEISDELKHNFFILKMILSEVALSWIISIYCFDKNLRYIAIIIILICLLAINVIAKHFLESKKDYIFLKWTNKDEKQIDDKN